MKVILLAAAFASLLIVGGTRGSGKAGATGSNGTVGNPAADLPPCLQLVAPAQHSSTSAFSQHYLVIQCVLNCYTPL